MTTNRKLVLETFYKADVDEGVRLRIDGIMQKIIDLIQKHKDCFIQFDSFPISDDQFNGSSICIKLTRFRNETDEEYSRRIKLEQEQRDLNKTARYKRYLELKKEFEPLPPGEEV